MQNIEDLKEIHRMSRAVDETFRDGSDESARRLRELELKQEDEFAARMTERLRVERWWATYNAALTGMLMIVTNIGDAERALAARRRVHGACVEAADEAHGPLVKP
jgi:hypothetical protein